MSYVLSNNRRYYLPLLPNVTAFPEGFQMIAGDQYLRNFSGPVPDTPLSFWPTYPADQYFLQQRALGFNCLNYDLGVTPEPSLYRHTMPSKDYLDAHCKDGLRLELAFPSCGNGSLDSTDRTSHVQYPSLVKEGNCPDGFDVHYPFLFFETIWATNAFAGQDGQFVLSYGDPVGTGYHGDFIMRWESADFLQQALDTCTNPSGMIQDCPLFDIQDDAVVQQCTFLMPESLMEDDCHGPRKGLPVDVPIQYGPEEATTYPIADRRGSPTTTIENTAAPATFADLSTFAYSPANPTSTKTALGGIVVAIESLQTIITTTIVALSQQQQQPPATTTGDSAVTTATKLVDGEVSEIVMLEVDITTTVTTTTTTFVSSSASAAASKKRHLDHHRNHVHHVRR